MYQRGTEVRHLLLRIYEEEIGSYRRSSNSFLLLCHSAVAFAVEKSLVYSGWILGC